jgi:acyl-coenzyme A thioesterase PaaI-like protein
MTLVHHELCFGCGRTNLFGLLMELEQVRPGLVTGRGFIKQDHQGAEPGTAHEGIVAAALSEAMSFACGPHMRAAGIEARLEAAVPVGVFLELEAQALDAPGGAFQASATATVADHAIATARGTYEPRTSPAA